MKDRQSIKMLHDLLLKYRPSLQGEALSYMKEWGQIRVFKKGTIYKRGHESNNNWCLILNGLVAKEHMDHRGKSSNERICTSGNYFVCTRHAYTQRAESFIVIFLADSLIYEIDNTAFQNAVKTFPDISYIYHVLKQQKLDYSHDLLHIRGLHFEFRVSEFHRRFPELVNLLTITQKRQFLKIGNNRDYYKSFRYYLKGGR